MFGFLLGFLTGAMVFPVIVLVMLLSGASGADEDFELLRPIPERRGRRFVVPRGTR